MSATLMNKPQWLEELAQFIVEANRVTWAGDGKGVVPERPGYKELQYQRGLWRLRDSYTGYFRAPGMTTVYNPERPVWTMSYGGKGQHEEYYDQAQETFSFLKAALMKVTAALPYRGPPEFTQNGKIYRCNVRGDITDFLGNEEIWNQGNREFSQWFGGGIVLHKDQQRQVIYPWDT